MAGDRGFATNSYLQVLVQGTLLTSCLNLDFVKGKQNEGGMKLLKYKFNIGGNKQMTSFLTNNYSFTSHDLNPTKKEKNRKSLI